MLMLAMAYMDFMGVVGTSGNAQGYLDVMPSYFAENVCKIENGKMIVDGRAELAIQLGNARSSAFPWVMEVLDVLCGESKRAATIRFTWGL